MNILYNFPTRSRKNKALSCLDNITYTSKTSDYKILLKIDEDDEACNCSDFIWKACKYPNVELNIGVSHNKIHAINRDIPEDGWSVCITFSDDMFIGVKGFDEIVINEYKNGFTGLLHFPDGHANERLCTFPIVDYKYYQLDKYIYNPAYANVYSDCEQQDVAKIRAMYKYMPCHGYITHNHPIWTGEEPDDLLLKTENPIGYVRDRNVYEKRKSINFGL